MEFEYIFYCHGYRCVIVMNEERREGYIQVPCGDKGFEQNIGEYNSHVFLGKEYPSWWIGFKSDKNLDMCYSQCRDIVYKLYKMNK